MGTKDTKEYHEGDIVKCGVCGKSLRVKYHDPKKTIALATAEALKGIALRCQRCGFIVCDPCSMPSGGMGLPTCPNCKAQAGGPYFFLHSTLAGAKAKEKYKPDKQPNVTPKPKIKTETTTTLKKCPFCGEEILAAAIKCKHCGEWLGEKPHVEGNTSGQGKLAVVPEEIKKWNWGAFLLSLIWGIGNNVWIALLCFIPYVNFIMIFVLGAKGSEWAWQKKRWDSIEHFKNVQKKWAIAGLVLFIFVIVMFIILAVYIASQR